MSPDLILKLSLSTFAMGARQLVVHDALEIRLSFSVRESSFTPRTTVASISSLGGTVRTTFFAPELMCFSKDDLSRKKPVDSTTKSTPKSLQGMFAGSSCEINFMVLSPTIKSSPFSSTCKSRTPIIESCLNKYTRFSRSPRSFIAITFKSEFDSTIILKIDLPILPNPFIPMLFKLTT